jgi:hypothetical protein
MTNGILSMLLEEEKFWNWNGTFTCQRKEKKRKKFEIEIHPPPSICCCISWTNLRRCNACKPFSKLLLHFSLLLGNEVFRSGFVYDRLVHCSIESMYHFLSHFYYWSTWWSSSCQKWIWVLLVEPFTGVSSLPFIF